MYKYRVIGSRAESNWIKVEADDHEITAHGALLILFKDGEEVAVVREWNELLKVQDES